MSIKIPFRKADIPNRLYDIIKRGMLSGSFDAVESLEERMSTDTGMQYAIATTTVTSALHLAMCALDLKRGDKVLCPVNSFVDMPEVVRHFDAEPVFVDTLPDSYAMDPEKLVTAAQKVKGKKLRAVLVNHLGGKMAPMKDIRKVANEYRLAVVEDVTERIGANDTGKTSDIAIAGFGSKTDNTINGGILLTDDDAYHKRAKLLSSHGMVYTSEETPYLYDVLDIGCQYTMSQYSAAYCLAQLEDNPQSLDKRKKLAKLYKKRLKGVKNIKLPGNDRDHTFAQFIIEIETNRDDFARKLRKKGIAVSVEFIPLNLTRYYKDKYNLKVFDFPVALDSYQKMMSLPIYASLTDDEANYVSDMIIEIAKTHK